MVDTGDGPGHRMPGPARASPGKEGGGGLCHRWGTWLPAPPGVSWAAWALWRGKCGNQLWGQAGSPGWVGQSSAPGHAPPRPPSVSRGESEGQAALRWLTSRDTVSVGRGSGPGGGALSAVRPPPTCPRRGLGVAQAGRDQYGTLGGGAGTPACLRGGRSGRNKSQAQSLAAHPASQGPHALHSGFQRAARTEARRAAPAPAVGRVLRPLPPPSRDPAVQWPRQTQPHSHCPLLTRGVRKRRPANRQAGLCRCCSSGVSLPELTDPWRLAAALSPWSPQQPDPGKREAEDGVSLPPRPGEFPPGRAGLPGLPPTPHRARAPWAPVCRRAFALLRPWCLRVSAPASSLGTSLSRRTRDTGPEFPSALPPSCLILPAVPPPPRC